MKAKQLELVLPVIVPAGITVLNEFKAEQAKLKEDVKLIEWLLHLECTHI